MEGRKFEYSDWIGDLLIVFKGTRYPGEKIVEGSVYADGNFICACLEEDFTTLMAELNDVINKHRI